MAPSEVSIPLSRPWIGDEEAEAASKVVAAGWLISGPRVAEFEGAFARLLGVKHAVAVNSGSSALLVAQAALGIGPGAEVLVPDMTFVSTASSSLFLGARPVFVDITLDDYGMDPADLERRITSQSRAVIPVHYAGQTARMEQILAVASEHGLPVIEDAAEAHLAEFNGAKAGTMGQLGIFSFTPSKLMTTGEGGMVVSDDEDLADRARLIRNFCDHGKFEWRGLGFNFRMPEALGAIGSIQLRKLSEACRRRRRIAERYTAAFAGEEGIVVPWARESKGHVFQLYTIRLHPEVVLAERDEVIQELSVRGVETRLYYPCLHRQGVFAECSDGHPGFPNAETFEATALSLPIYPTMTHEEIERVIESVVDVLRSHKRRR